MTGFPKPPWPKPSEDDAERAKQVAREQGWLTDDGWIWDEPVASNPDSPEG